MSAYSTIDITRERAMQIILAQLIGASDEQIADVLFELYGRERLYNYRIVDSTCDCDQD